MSEILINFAEPLHEILDNEDVVLTLGMTAWNAAIFPEKERERMIDEITAKRF